MSTKTSSKTSFTVRYADLQNIVAWFEGRDIDLEEGIKKYEEGMKIVKELKEYLGKMENRIKELKKN